MSDDSIVQQLLPRPPWRLHADFVRGQQRRVALFFALALGAGFYAQRRAADLVAIANDCAVHAAADVTVSASWQGTQTRSGRLGCSTTGWVSYQFENGLWASHHLELDTAWPFPTSRLSVAYVRAEPSRWVTSWAVEQTWNRFWAALLWLGCSGALTGWALWCAVANTRLLRLARDVAADGVVRLGTWLGHERKTDRRHKLAALRHRIRVATPEGRQYDVYATFPAGAGAPLILPGKRAVVIVPADGARSALVLRQDLWPLHLRDEDAARTGELLHQVDPDAGWRTSMTTRGLRVSCRPRFRRK
jgi:hypothetical protein